MFIPPFPLQTRPIRLRQASAPLIGANERPLCKSQMFGEMTTPASLACKKGVPGEIPDLSRPQSTNLVATDAFFPTMPPVFVVSYSG